MRAQYANCYRHASGFRLPKPSVLISKTLRALTVIDRQAAFVLFEGRLHAAG